MEQSRRRFFQRAGAGMVTLGLSSPFSGAAAWGINEKTSKKQDLFGIGIAGWSFVKIGLDAALDMMNRVNIKSLCIKNFHLPLDSTPDQVAGFLGKLKARGITGHGVGPIYMTSEAEVDQAFEYARLVGVKLLVGVPEHQLLPYVNRKVKEYDLYYAIHNHGREDKRYPTVASIYDMIKSLDTRVGICHDIGYSMQMGFQPADVTLKYGQRIYEMHVKDMVNTGGKWTDCEIGRGAIDFPALVRALRKTRYAGSCSIENEKNANDPLPGLAESIGYFKAVINIT